MVKELPEPDYNNTPGFYGPVGRVELLRTNKTVRVSIEFDDEHKFIDLIMQMVENAVPMNICFYLDKENCTIDRIFLTALNPYTINKLFCEKQPESKKERWSIN